MLVDEYSYCAASWSRLGSISVAGKDLLTRERLPTAESVLTLGALAVRFLQERGIVTLFVALDGTVQICPPAELLLDALTEDDAIARLLEMGRDENGIISYLKGREARRLRLEDSNAQNL